MTRINRFTAFLNKAKYFKSSIAQILNKMGDFEYEIILMKKENQLYREGIFFTKIYDELQTKIFVRKGNL